MSSAGQIVGGIVGAVVGFYVGGPQGAVMGAQVGMGVGGYIDPPKGPQLNGPRLSDLSAQTSTYGSPIPRIYGTVATHGNVIWLQGNKLTEVARKEKQGGKGGGGGATVKTYSYYATFAVGLADVSKTGPIQGVRRIWVGGNLIYDAGTDDLETIIASNQAAQGFRIYFGDEDQQPDPRMQADVGVANCPAYRGLAYIVFYDFALKDYGNSLMAAQVKVEVCSIATTSGLRKVWDDEIKYENAEKWVRYPLSETLYEAPEFLSLIDYGVVSASNGDSSFIISNSSQVINSKNRPVAPLSSYNLISGPQTLYPFDATHIGSVQGGDVWVQYSGASSPSWWIIVFGGVVIFDSYKYWSEGIFCHGVSVDDDNGNVVLFLENESSRKYVKIFPGGFEQDHNLPAFDGLYAVLCGTPLPHFADAGLNG